ncbi:spore coat putative kinase YutH [Anoxybacillus kestanbolensis]|uniref:spore coat putative kinase YutH n=1 Tax=Anoxybacillus kestanbolensis TaxID=227476 RepID=UPI003D197FBD
MDYYFRIDHIEKIGDRFIVRSGDDIYVAVPTNEKESDMQQLYYMAMYMRAQGDETIATLLPTKTGRLIGMLQGEQVSVWKIENRMQMGDIAQQLALFHRRGRTYPYAVSSRSRFGQWGELWGQRIDQLEQFWQLQVESPKKNDVDKRFIETFPYYLGFTENAIQYVVDTQLDEVPMRSDMPTICHEQFSQQTWETGKIPTDWVFDHASRDVAEWIRKQWLTARSDETIVRFLQTYEHSQSLSRFAWRMIYARLLFPLHYFQAIENYYGSEGDMRQSYAQQLRQVFDGMETYEQKLRHFHDMTTVSIPRLDWL